MINQRLPLLVVVLVVIFFVGFVGFFAFLDYEKPVTQIAKKEKVEIVAHVGGRSGKASAKPYFIAKRQSGVQIKIPDWGEIPYTYTGPAVMNIGESGITGLPVFSINRKETIYLMKKDYE
mgnify:CR=1 FL=1